MAPIKQSPLLTASHHHGATATEMAGWRFARSYTSLESEMTAARERVALADVSPHGKLHIEGASAREAVATAFGSAPEQIGAGLHVGAGQLYRLRADQFYLSTPPGGEAQAQTQLEAAIAAHNVFVTVTDQTHGLADLRLTGPASRAVLSKLCGLDFAEDAFPNLTARQTSAAKTRQLIIRRDFGPLPTYTLVGAQSLAAYLWDVVLEAGREFGIEPIGVAALRELEAVP